MGGGTAAGRCGPMGKRKRAAHFLHHEMAAVRLDDASKARTNKIVKKRAKNAA